MKSETAARPTYPTRLFTLGTCSITFARGKLVDRLANILGRGATQRGSSRKGGAGVKLRENLPFQYVKGSPKHTF